MWLAAPGAPLRKLLRDGIEVFRTRRRKSRPERWGGRMIRQTWLPPTADFSLKCCDLDGLPPIRIRYWPAYSNPYQELFYGIASQGFTAQPGDGVEALCELTRDSKQLVCFHVHWLNFLFKEAVARANGNDVFDEFLDTCARIREKGGIVAWTVHNLKEHESPNPAFETEFRRKLAQIADIVIVHGRAARDAALENFGVSPERIVDVPHGSYIGVYEDIAERGEARAHVCAPDRQTIFVNVGAMRPYKGLDDLVSAIFELEREGASVGLLLAGGASAEHAKVLSEHTRSSETIRMDLGRVDDRELQYYLNAADFMVVPYRTILTSGSAILALSFGRPVIAPAMGALVELIEDGVSGFLYDAEDPTGLTRALTRAVNTDSATRARMSQAAFSRATTLRWSEARSALVEAIALRNARRNVA